MPLPDIFTQEVSGQLIARINRLAPDTRPQWGLMDAGQMLAHLNVMYELVYEHKHPRPGLLMKFMLKTFVKKIVTSEVPYKRSSRTAPAFLIRGTRNFEQERQRLADFIGRTQQLGAHSFDGRESHSFGPLSRQEWNNMFYKHLDHHLTQFGV